MPDAWANRIVGEGEVRAEELLPNLRNWRRHPHTQGEALTGVLAGVGWVQRVIVNRRTGQMIDGHLRVKLARKLGADTLVPVEYVDLSEQEELAILASLDPLAGMAEADLDALAGVVQDAHGLGESMDAALEAIASAEGLATATTAEDAEPQTDLAEELREKWGVENGQLWQLGDHRLICGDCTDAAVVARVMGGEKATMLTDPPYGINVVRPLKGGSAAAKPVTAGAKVGVIRSR